MIGKEQVSLVPAESTRWAYARIWEELSNEPEFAASFGDIPDGVMRIGWGKERNSPYKKFVIKLGAEGRYIGVAAIEHDIKNAVCFIIMGLVAEHRGKKLGTVAARLLMRHCFEKLGANRVESSALSTNPASIAMQDGMIQEGVLKNRLWIADKQVWADEIVYRLLRSEWVAQIAERERVKCQVEA